MGNDLQGFLKFTLLAYHDLLPIISGIAFFQIADSRSRSLPIFWPDLEDSSSSWYFCPSFADGSLPSGQGIA
jgi:hypothetical protein